MGSQNLARQNRANRKIGPDEKLKARYALLYWHNEAISLIPYTTYSKGGEPAARLSFECGPRQCTTSW